MAWKFSKEALESGAVEASSEMLEKAEVVSGSETVERSSEQLEADIEKEQKEIEAQAAQFSQEADALTAMELTEDEKEIVEEQLEERLGSSAQSALFNVGLPALSVFWGMLAEQAATLAAFQNNIDATRLDTVAVGLGVTAAGLVFTTAWQKLSHWMDDKLNPEVRKRIEKAVFAERV